MPAPLFRHLAYPAETQRPGDAPTRPSESGSEPATAATAATRTPPIADRTTQPTRTASITDSGLEIARFLIEDGVIAEEQLIYAMRVRAKLSSEKPLLSDVTFETTLPYVMRQDPDVIVPGEIRDRFSAEAAIQAALTGHKVLTTFHTEDTIGGLLRLMNMDIETFLTGLSLTYLFPSCPRRRVSIFSESYWIPAYAGMTKSESPARSLPPWSRCWRSDCCAESVRAAPHLISPTAPNCNAWTTSATTWKAPRFGRDAAAPRTATPAIRAASAFSSCSF